MKDDFYPRLYTTLTDVKDGRGRMVIKWQLKSVTI